MNILFAPFFVLVMLDGGAVAVLVCDRVLRAGTLTLTVGLNADRLRMCCLNFLLLDC